MVDPVNSASQTKSLATAHIDNVYTASARADKAAIAMYLRDLRNTGEAPFLDPYWRPLILPPCIQLPSHHR